MTPGEVHVWRVRLDEHDAERLEPWLDPGERERAGRFHRPRDRARFVVAHAALRGILGRYLALPPDVVPVVSRPPAKPRLSGQPLRFNLAHADGLALCAVAADREVGVDVERVRDDVPAVEIAARYFAPAEVTRLRALPAEARTEAFFRLWVTKEAYVKACGDGLRRPLDEAPPATWTLREVDVDPGYVAAVGAEGGEWRLRCLDWPRVDREGVAA